MQFPGHSQLLWGEAKVRRERRSPEFSFYALVRVLQRLQERLDTTKQEHLQGEVSWKCFFVSSHMITCTYIPQLSQILETLNIKPVLQMCMMENVGSGEKRRNKCLPSN